MRRLLALPVLASALLLAGCVVGQAPSGPQGDRVDDDRIDIPAPSCDGPAFLNTPNTHYDLGTCDEVTVEGQGITVEAGDIGTLIIRGDGNDVEAYSIGVVEIGGQDNAVAATDIGSIDIRGDRNRVGAEGDIGALKIGGNANEITGETIGTRDLSGDGNVVQSD